MAANQFQSPIILGFNPSNPVTAPSTLALSATATWLAFSFVPDTSKTINKVRVFVSAVAGTLAATDLTCDIYSDNAGNPNASLGTTSTVNATPTGAAWVEFSGLSIALTAGTQYWIVLKNANGVPGTNFPTYSFQSGTALLGPQPLGNTAVYGWSKKSSTNSGTSWASVIQPACGYRVGYSDSTYAGFPYQASAIGTTPINGTNEEGAKWVLPANATFNVRGLAVYMASQSGAPTGNLLLKLYSGTTLLATATAIPNANAKTGNVWFTAYFSSAQSVAGGTTIRVTAASSAAETGSNYFRMEEITMDADANSIPLYPSDGTFQKTIWNGTTWDDSTTSTLVAAAILLDTGGEFAVTGGSGGGAPIIGSSIVRGLGRIA